MLARAMTRPAWLVVSRAVAFVSLEKSAQGFFVSICSWPHLPRVAVANRQQSVVTKGLPIAALIRQEYNESCLHYAARIRP